MFRFFPAKSHSKFQNRAVLNRHLTMQTLEGRALMAADLVPAYSSLPGADQTIYLDFNGHIQANWRRTDVNPAQNYQDVRSSSYNTDGIEGFNQSELDDIRAIWAAVSEDFAPFDVNVTTVEPTSFADYRAVRVVIGGSQSALLETSPGKWKALQGNVFVSNNGIRTLEASGYASNGSFTNNEPNVVYVFANQIRNALFDNENRAINHNLAIATTASHEAGHAFGLEHHTGRNISGMAAPYDIGDSLRTPIMGNNLAHDRTQWSNSVSSGDNVATLTTVLGARSDDHSDNLFTARNLVLNPAWSDSWGQSGVIGRATGVISTLSDADAFSFSTSGGQASLVATPVENGNLDIRLELYRWTSVVLGSITTRVPLLVTSVDPIQLGGFWQAALDARLNMYLAAGQYTVVVGSHQSYGDLGQYSLAVSISSPSANSGTGWGGSFQPQIVAERAITASALSPIVETYNRPAVNDAALIELLGMQQAGASTVIRTFRGVFPDTTNELKFSLDGARSDAALGSNFIVGKSIHLGDSQFAHLDIKRT